jgi:hypothetical protein
MKNMFSPTEMKVLKILGRKKMTISEITTKLCGKHKKSINAGNIVAYFIRRINMKCKFHKLDWFLNGKGAGRLGRTVWRSKKV